MYLHQNADRLRTKEFYTISNTHDKETAAGGKLRIDFNTRSTSPLSNQPHTAEYLQNLPRPLLEDGMQHVEDPLFQRFAQGEIPDDRAHQLQIAQTCMDYGLPSTLAWLFAKTKITEFTYRSSAHNLSLETLATALKYRGLSLSLLVIEIPYLNTHQFEGLELNLKFSDSLKKLDFSNTAMCEVVLNSFSSIKGLNGEIVVTGGRLYER